MDFNSLPNFYLIGAAKSGTTTIHDALKQHPKIGLPLQKEPFFWGDDEKFSNGLQWYLDTFFPRDIGNYPARGEASPQSLYWSEKVAPRMKEVYGDGDLKLIAIFRNPVERAYSHYWMYVKFGWDEVKTFEEAIRLEEKRHKEQWSEFYAHGKMTYGYLRGGHYVTQLRPFLDRFQKNQFLFLLQEDLKGNFQCTMDRIVTFLGLKTSIDFKPIVSNAAATPRSLALAKLLKTPMPAKIIFKIFLPLEFRKRLKQKIRHANFKPFQYPEMPLELQKELTLYYADEMQQLEKIIGRDLSTWIL